MANQTTPYVAKDGRLTLNIDSNKTLAITDCGIVQNVIADSVVVTLPSTVVGYNFIVRNGGVAASSSVGYGTGADASVLVSVSPAALDSIAGGTWTAADNKDALNTKATAKVGDEISLVGDGVNGWMATSLKGVWAREA